MDDMSTCFATHISPYIQLLETIRTWVLLCLQAKLVNYQLTCNIDTTFAIYDNTTNSVLNMTAGVEKILTLLFTLVIARYMECSQKN